jgi:hypothetical protein
MKDPKAAQDDAVRGEKIKAFQRKGLSEADAVKQAYAKPKAGPKDAPAPAPKPGPKAPPAPPLPTGDPDDPGADPTLGMDQEPDPQDQQDQYPGPIISLSTDDLNRLGLSKDPAVGSALTLTADVHGISSRRGPNGPERNLDICITGLKQAGKDQTDAAPEGDDSSDY